MMSYYFIADINECNSCPCENGATCNDEVNSYNCTCVEGYNGTTCQTGIFNITMMYFPCLFDINEDTIIQLLLGVFMIKNNIYCSRVLHTVQALFESNGVH